MASPYYHKFDFSNPRKWLCVYPAYINSNKKLTQGRRIAKKWCVEDPLKEEIKQVLDKIGFETLVEDKVNTKERDKDNPIKRGRVRVHNRNDDGSLKNSSYPTKNHLLIYVGTAIQKLRIEKQGGAVPGEAVPGATVPSEATPAVAFVSGLASGGTIPSVHVADDIVVISQGEVISSGTVTGASQESGGVTGLLQPSGAVTSTVQPTGIVLSGTVTGGAITSAIQPTGTVPGGTVQSGNGQVGAAQNETPQHANT